MIVVVPMAGRGARLAGSARPKPLINVAGRPMVAWAWESLASLPRSRAVFVALAQHEEEFGLSAIVRTFVAEPEFVFLDDVTEGQLCTVLAARSFIDVDEDVLVASADTYVVSELASDLERRFPESRGLVSVIDVPGDRWSFARTDGTTRVVEVAEKRRISNHASTGLYWFASGCELVEMADEMIRERDTTRGEYYVMPLFARFLRRGLRVDVSVASAMWDMGTPQALEGFERAVAAGSVP